MSKQGLDDIFVEIQSLVDAQASFAGLTAAQCRRLEELVTSDPAAADFYVQYVEETAAIRQWAGTLHSLGGASAAVGARVVADDEDDEDLADVDGAATMRAGETMILPAVSTREADEEWDEPAALDSPPIYPLVPQAPPPRRWIVIAVSSGLAAAAAIALAVGVFLSTRTPKTTPQNVAQSAGRHLNLPTTFPTTQPIVSQTAPASRPSASPRVVEAPEPPPEPPAPPPRAGAVLADAIDAKWDGSAPTFRQDVGVDTLRLESGLVKLVYESGAEVIVQGPAEITAEGPQRLTLSRGRVATRVPHEAAGFTLRTPTARVIDLGTEFAASVEPGKRTDVHVLVGEVSVAPQESNGSAATAASTAPAPAIVKAGAAVAVTEQDRVVAERRIEPLSFVNVEEFDARSELTGSEPSPAARWIAHSYAVRRDPTLRAYYLFEKDGERAMNVAPLGYTWRGGPFGEFRDADNKPVKATYAVGRLPERVAASFDGGGRHITLRGSANLINFGRQPNTTPVAEPFTVSMWVKVDAANTNRYPAFIAKGKARREQFAMDVGDGHFRFWVRQKDFDDKSIGRVVGPPPQPNAWQHVAGVYDPDPKDPHVEFFVDGKSCGRARAPRWLLNTEEDVLIGARTWASYDGAEGRPFDLALNGCVDEIAFFTAAKTANEVKELYEGGRP